MLAKPERMFLYTSFSFVANNCENGVMPGNCTGSNGLNELEVANP